MGFFRRKKKVSCASCNVELDLNEARVENGKYFCPACDIRRKSAAAQAAKKQQEQAAKTAAETVHPAIAQIKEAFDSSDLHSAVTHSGDQWEVHAGISGKANSYTVKFICKDNGDNDVAIRVFDLVSFPKGKEQTAYRLLNGFQRQYRFLSFTLDKNNAVVVSYDMPSKSVNVGPAAREMLFRIMKMIDDIYPELMRAIWA